MRVESVKSNQFLNKCRKCGKEIEEKIEDIVDEEETIKNTETVQTDM